MEFKFVLTFGLLMVSPCLGYFTFKSRIPNGNNIPHPCKVNYMWGGVGHTNPDGGGERNPFGKDFKDSGYQWTRTLCMADSDGDGVTNGQELGDPNCVWQEGQVPERVSDISHPGICTPYGEGICAGKDTFVDCSLETFGESCDVIKNSDVKTTDFSFQRVSVPNTETNYYCQYFDLPSDQDYHIVANEALIDNHDVLHHMILYGCPNDYKSSPEDSSPRPCFMGDDTNGCFDPISLWTVGLAGTCFGDDRGFRIGPNGYKKVKLEIHYNNPMLVTDFTDASGMRIFYQPMKPDVKNLATYTVGQNKLAIPPGEERVDIKGVCPGQCRKSTVTAPIYAIATISHMHYLGVEQKTEVIRDGQVIKVLAHDKPYSYDSPQIHDHEPPFEILPGDDIVTTCTYNSMSRKRWVYFGDGTNDEMCFAFLTVYPEEALRVRWCTARGPLSTCELYGRQPKYGCDWARFANLSNPEMIEHYVNLQKDCNLNGVCRQECRELIETMGRHPCLQNEEMQEIVTSYLNTYKEGIEFMARYRSCHQDDDRDCHHKECPECRHDHDGDDDWTSGSTSLPLPKMAVLLAASLIAMVPALF